MRLMLAATVAVAGLVVTGAACDARTPGGTDPGVKPGGAGMVITSSAFAEGGGIPSKHTCEGANVSPPLAWAGVPEGAKSLVLIVDDPDAPDPAAPKMDWVHWVVYDLPATANGLAEAQRAMPPGTRLGTNDFGKTAWGGPCPPIGRHRYFFRLHALDVVLPDLGAADRAGVEAAMKGHVLASAQLVGTYAKAAR